MPRRKLEDVLAGLGRVRADPASASSLLELRGALEGASAIAAAKAARLIGDFEIAALAPDLIAAFQRFLAAPGKDPGCAAKTAMADALYRLGEAATEVFLAGLHHVQMEPIFGGRVDAAIDLRGTCALGLVRSGHPRALPELADLLADREPPVRAAAARALAYRGGQDGVPLLRLRVLAGDTAAVIGECLEALLRLDPGAGLPFAGRFLDSADEPVAEVAALALGASRLEEAFPLLRDWAGRVARPALRRAGLLAIATLRRDAAVEYLLGLLREAPSALAVEAADALVLFRGDEALAVRAREAAASRDEPGLRQAVAKAFD